MRESERETYLSANNGRNAGVGGWVGIAGVGVIAHGAPFALVQDLGPAAAALGIEGCGLVLEGRG